MIRLPENALCRRCKHNPQVFQPSTDSEQEWMICDEYDPIPVDVLKGGQCDQYEESDGFAII
jgi:hypothetical protein